MPQNDQPLPVLSSDELGPLVPCPLCGADKGYNLDEGSTYRWWSVCCAECGQEVSEARAKYPAETTPRVGTADHAWNEAGRHANQLRQALRQVAQAHAWLAFGECRSFGADVALLSPSDADAVARVALGEFREGPNDGSNWLAGGAACIKSS